MTLVEISKTLNSSIVPAIMGDDFTVNPNLDNICDLGTVINAMTADQFKTYLNLHWGTTMQDLPAGLVFIQPIKIAAGH